ncbi:hypothetical protein N7516_009771 [Penicillium verrucosum]|uniref:uncharacterized protein n=1 Tax=Penicillium verrucosum TaxID=60171 RepID=UPI00254596C8|nr:uncharacterized protein N7516_009771 [Penicillium verrucosum]KAJ5922068.1 hypothetical protein N7516_009771 [Penicillium verrucosum]
MKSKLDRPRRIPTPNHEQLELLMQLRLRAVELSFLRDMALREAAYHMCYVEALMHANESSNILVLLTLELIIANLLHRLISLCAEEQAYATIEQELWHQITE